MQKQSYVTCRAAARLIAGLIASCAALISFAGAAGAAEDVNDYEAITGVDRLPNPGQYTDHSGVALLPDGRILAVDNGEDVIIEYFPNGAGGWNLGRIFPVGRICVDLDEDEEEDCEERFSEPVDDLEDITFMGGNKFALIDENDNSLMVFTIPSSGTDVTEIYSLDLWPYVDNFGGNGIEGLAYSFDDSVPGTDTFYVASESNALLVRLDIVDGNVTYRGPDVRLRIPSASAVHDVQGEDVFYIVANRARELYRFNGAGVQLGPPRPLTGFFNPEGITFSPDLNRMIVVGEAGQGNQIQDFQAPAGQPGQTTYARITSSGADVHESAGSLTTNSSVLPIGQSAKDFTGLRFNSVCVPENAVITSAHLAMFPNGFSNAPTELRIEAQRTPNPGAFRPEVLRDLSNRIPTVNSVTQNTGGWFGNNRVHSPDLSAVLTEVINQPGWASCNPVALRLSGTGGRNAASFDLNPELAATLVVNYVEGPDPDPLSISIALSCFADAGRVDVTLVNNFSVPRDVTLEFSGLPDRTKTVAAFSQSTVTYTGRNNGRYLVGVLTNGATNTNQVVELACKPTVDVRNMCLAQNGLFHIWVYNPTPAIADFVVTVDGLQPRQISVAPFSRKRSGVSGRRDGVYGISVANESGVQISDDSATVACDPPPPTQEITFTVGCLSTNGIVTTTLYNDSLEPVEYTVQFGQLSDRARTVGAGQIAKVNVTGRPDGAHSVTVLRNGVTARQVTLFVNCDNIG